MTALRLLLLLLPPGCGQPAAQATSPNAAQAAPGPAGTDAGEQAIMDRIEREIRLPEGAAPLATYARSYAWQQREDNVRKVVAVYENLTGAPAGRRWATGNEFPLVLDGGCGLITLSYDVAARRIEHVTCNGEA
jgi:hypothetical protein